MTGLSHHFSFQSFKKFPWIFGLSWCYWIYLLFSTQMLLSADAIGFEDLGRSIHEKGIGVLFREGPAREPLYPLSIAFSMFWAEIFSVHYSFIQKIIQISALFVTQCLLLKNMFLFNVKKQIAGAVAVYFAFSPAIVNSGFSLFSEVLTYPFVLGIVLCGWAAANNLGSWSTLKSSLAGCLAGVLFIGVVSVKALYEYVFFGFVLIFIFHLLSSLGRRKIKKAANAVLFLSLLSLTFYGYLHGYKSLNQKYNGLYAFTDRGTWMLYGTAKRRTQPMDAGRALAGLASIPGDNVCKKFFSEEDCYFWHFETIVNYGVPYMQELHNEEGATRESVESTLMQHSVRIILHHPFQYGLFYVLEGLRVFFWESTQIGFVGYPPWMTKVFAFGPFKDMLRLAVSLLTGISFIYMTGFVIGKRKLFADEDADQKRKLNGILVILVLAWFHIGCSAFFCVLTRHVFPIVPLYLLIIGLFVDRCVRWRSLYTDTAEP